MLFVEKFINGTICWNGTISPASSTADSFGKRTSISYFDGNMTKAMATGRKCTYIIAGKGSIINICNITSRQSYKY